MTRTAIHRRANSTAPHGHSDHYVNEAFLPLDLKPVSTGVVELAGGFIPRRLRRQIHPLDNKLRFAPSTHPHGNILRFALSTTRTAMNRHANSTAPHGHSDHYMNEASLPLD